MSVTRGRPFSARVIPLAIFITALAFALLNAIRYERRVSPAYVEISFDLTTYLRAHDGIRSGGLPYRDFAFEYPPTAAYYLAAPAIEPRPSRIAYLHALILMNALVCGGIWGAILIRMREHGTRAVGLTALLGGAAFFVDELVFARFDAPIAFATGGALLLLTRAPEFWAKVAGGSLGLLAGLKIFPIVFVGALLTRRDGERRSWRAGAIGIAVGLMPSVLLIVCAGSEARAFVAYHAGRHLEFGSLYSSIARLYEPCRISVEYGAAECRLPDERAYLVASTLLTIFGTLVPLVASFRSRSLIGALWWGTVALYGFILFNKVGSPQYALWPLAAAIPLMIDRPRRAVPFAAAVLLGMIIVRILMSRYDTGGGGHVASQWALMKNIALIVGGATALYGAIDAGRDARANLDSDESHLSGRGIILTALGHCTVFSMPAILLSPASIGRRS